MKMVAQHLGMLKTKTELSGPNGEPIQHSHSLSAEDLTDEQLAAIIGGKVSRQQPVGTTQAAQCARKPSRLHSVH